MVPLQSPPPVRRAGRGVAGFALGDPPATAPACSDLPSGSSAMALLGGDWNALPLAVGHTALRAVLIGTGMFLSGERSAARLARNAAAGSLAIEAFVLSWAAWKRTRSDHP